MAIRPRKAAKPPAAKAAPKAAKSKLLSGGNPQIAKGEGDAPVKAYIAAAPGWKSDACRKIDALITKAVPGIQKAVKWNSPLYGVEPKHWILSLHVYDRYIKVAFFRGAQLKPVPPVASKQPDVRYFHLHEDDKLDKAQVSAWVKQASKLPGMRM